LERRCGNAQGEAAAGGVTDQGQRRLRVGLANHRNEIGEIVLELADIADIAARARSAMTANINGEGFHTVRGQSVGQRMDAGTRPGGAMNQNRHALNRRSACRIVAVRQSSSVAALKTLQGGHGAAIDRTRGLRDGSQWRRLREWCRDKGREQQRRSAHQAQDQPHGEQRPTYQQFRHVRFLDL
jgi:hypothetical protein